MVAPRSPAQAGQVYLLQGAETRDPAVELRDGLDAVWVEGRVRLFYVRFLGKKNPTKIAFKQYLKTF